LFQSSFTVIVLALHQLSLEFYKYGALRSADYIFMLENKQHMCYCRVYLLFLMQLF